MSTSNGSDLIAAVMREYGGLTSEALKQYLPDREPRRYL